MASATTVPGRTPQAPLDDRVRRGRSVRTEVPRRSHGEWAAPAARRDPVAILEEQAGTRVPEFVPIRYGRMLASPFAFFRGAAAVMAADLDPTPRSGVHVQLCGDAQLCNFGVFAAPDGLRIDVNDFDETASGPWEWDVKRLAASVEVAGRDVVLRARDRRGAVRATVRAYREAMRELAAATDPAVWDSRLDAARCSPQPAHGLDDEHRFLGDWPLVTPIDELSASGERSLVEAAEALLSAYAENLPPDRRGLLDGYRYARLVRHAVGVGSVGTRAWTLLLERCDGGDPLVLQVKEAHASALEPYTRAADPANHGRRVVAGQQLLQATPDRFLGWFQTTRVDGQPRDFYVRRLWDRTRRADLEQASARGLLIHGQSCGRTLARAHARSGDRVAIAAYLGSGTHFDDALASFAAAYADQNELDYAALEAAGHQGRVAVLHGL